MSRTRFAAGPLSHVKLNQSLDELEALFTGNPSPNGNVVGMADLQIAGRARIGPYGWLEAAIPVTELFAQMSSLSNRGGPGAVFGSRSSDDLAQGYAESGWGAGFFALNDNATYKKTMYGAYYEVRRQSEGVKGHTYGMEVTPLNEGDVKWVTPYELPDGTTWAFRSSVGTTSKTNHVSGIAGFIGGAPRVPNDPTTAAKFGNGFVFYGDCIAPHRDLGRPIVMDMTANQTFVWRNKANANPTSYITSIVGLEQNSGTLPGAGGKLIFDNNGWSLLNGQGAGITAHDTGVAFSGTATFGAGAIFTSDVVLQRGISIAMNAGISGTLNVNGAVGLSSALNVAGAVNFQAGARVNLPAYASNAAARAAGLVAGDLYQNNGAVLVTI